MSSLKSILDMRWPAIWLVAACLVLSLGACGDDEGVDTGDNGNNGDSDRTDVVQTAYGDVQGRMAEGVQTFLGIPYAAPPTGDLRWRPPEAPDEWQDTLQADAYGDTCAQSDTLGVFAAPSQSEDCLFLNVFAPSDSAADASLPVLVWIHGGGLFDGESNDYDGSKLARQGDTVVVTINYRLNVFGFLALPGLDDEDHPFANYGFMDQQFALQWVRDNIANFGGDPDNVTIFGESAGGTSVFANLISPEAEGLFDRGIVESGSGVTTTDLDTAEARGQAFAEAVGCDSDDATQTVSCLRSLSVAEIQSMAPEFSAQAPVAIDGTVITQTQEAALSSGDFNQVPIIDGSNRDEARFFVGLKELQNDESLSADGYPDAVRNGYGKLSNGYGEDTSQILDEYPLGDYESPALALSAVQTDQVFVCPHLHNDVLLTQYVPTYVYEFADRTTPSYAPLASFPYGAYHTGEIQYLFPQYSGAQGTPQTLNDAQQALSDDMVSYWTTFAAAGDPNGPNTPDWPRYQSGQYLSLELPTPQTMSIDDLRTRHHCDFWDNLEDRD